MIRIAGHLLCVALLLALPSLRVLCTDLCVSTPDVAATHAEEPACHDSHTDPAAPAPRDPGDGCAHGDASSSPLVVRPVANGAFDQVETLVTSWSPHLGLDFAAGPIRADQPLAPAYPPSGFLSPLRC